jgi:hypothetical protein
MTRTTNNVERTPVLLRHETEQSPLGQFQVNVIFTDSRATVHALKVATELAAGLCANIRIRVAVAVPMRLPLDHPQVSIIFMKKVLSDLVAKVPHDCAEITGHLYLCRERIEAILHVLVPNSLVVIAGPKRPWPTVESRIAKRLQSEGHRVLFTPIGAGIECDLR